MREVFKYSRCSRICVSNSKDVKMPSTKLNGVAQSKRFERQIRIGVFSTGQFAELLGVCPRTVTQWIDIGKLKGYRLPSTQNNPNNQHNRNRGERRILLKDILDFLDENKLPYPSALLEYNQRVYAAAFGVDAIPGCAMYPTSAEFGVDLGSLRFDFIKAVVLGDNQGMGQLVTLMELLHKRMKTFRLYICIEPEHVPLLQDVTYRLRFQDLNLHTTPVDWSRIACDISSIVPQR